MHNAFGTQNGEAKAVIQDVVSYEKTQETLAMLRILALVERDIRELKYWPFREVVAQLRSKTLEKMLRRASMSS